MGNWSDVPLELLVLIVDRLKLIEDFVAFRGVCSSWRSVSAKEKFTGITQLACAVHAPNVFTLSKAAIYHLHRRPPTPTHGPYRYCFKHRYFASKGWLFEINIHGGTCLFHPFLGAFISLPHVTALPELYKCDDYEKDLIVEAVLTLSPSFSSNYALILRYESSSTTGLAFWRPGKRRFIELNSYKPLFQWFAITSCKKGQLYTLDLSGTIVIWDTKDVPIVQFVIKSPCLSEHRLLCIDPWLILFAEYDGEVYLVGRTTHNIKDLLVVHRIDVTNKKCVKVNDLGNRALFFGVRARVCFFMEPSEIPECMPNHIYLDEKRIYYKKHVPVDDDDGDEDSSKAKPGIYRFPNGPLAPFKRKRHILFKYNNISTS